MSETEEIIATLRKLSAQPIPLTGKPVSEDIVRDIVGVRNRIGLRAAEALEAERARAEKAEALVVESFYEEKYPRYNQGLGKGNELCYPVTAGELNGLVERIKALEEALRDARDNGLVYWVPQTDRGAVQKPLMIARITKVLAGGERT